MVVNVYLINDVMCNLRASDARVFRKQKLNFKEKSAFTENILDISADTNNNLCFKFLINFMREFECTRNKEFCWDQVQLMYKLYFIIIAIKVKDNNYRICKYM